MFDSAFFFNFSDGTEFRSPFTGFCYRVYGLQLMDPGCYRVFFSNVTGFNRVLLGFTEFCWVQRPFSVLEKMVPSFLGGFTGFYRVLPSFTDETQFYRVFFQTLLGFTGFSWLHYRVSLGFTDKTELYRVLLGFIGLTPRVYRH